MKRSGSTLHFQIALRLLELTNSGRSLTWIPEESLNTDEYAMEAKSGYLLCKCHSATDSILKQFHSGNAVGIYSFRDPRDVCASWQRKSTRSFEQLLTTRLIEDCCEQYEIFARLPRMYIRRYEDFVGDIAGEAGRIANHLSLTVTPEQCHWIAEDLSIENQRARQREIEHNKRPTSRDGEVVFDSKELLHSNHITSNGDSTWRTFYSPDEQRRLNERLAPWIKLLGYE